MNRSEHDGSGADRAEGPGAPVDAGHGSFIGLDGVELAIRPVESVDGPALVAFHDRLSLESTRMRFFTPVPHLTSLQVDHFTHVDHDDREALVILDGDDIVAIAALRPPRGPVRGRGRLRRGRLVAQPRVGLAPAATTRATGTESCHRTPGRRDAVREPGNAHRVPTLGVPDDHPHRRGRRHVHDGHRGPRRMIAAGVTPR